MTKTEKVLRTVAKNLKMKPKGIESYSGRCVLTDTFTTIMTAKEGTDISLWAYAHKKFIDENWDKVKDEDIKPTNPYQELVIGKLKKCERKPEVEIIYETNMEGVEVVVYTDTLDAMVAEAERFKGVGK